LIDRSERRIGINALVLRIWLALNDHCEFGGWMGVKPGLWREIAPPLDFIGKEIVRLAGVVGIPFSGLFLLSTGAGERS